MPYIQEHSRQVLDPHIDALIAELGLAGGTGGIGYAVGELNYIFTRLIVAALGNLPKYVDYNAAIGVLESCKLELYRRAVAGYENGKADEHGDVY